MSTKSSNEYFYHLVDSSDRIIQKTNDYSYALYQNIINNVEIRQVPLGSDGSKWKVIKPIENQRSLQL